MAVVLVDSFDTYNGAGANTGLAAKWTTNGTVTMITGRFAGQALSFQSFAGSGGAQRTLPASYASVGLGFAIRFTTMPSAITVTPHIMLRSGATYMMGLRVNSDGSIAIYRLTSATAGTSLGTAPAGTIVLNTWHFIEWGTTISDTVGVVNLKVDSVSHLALTSQDTRNGVPTTVDTLVLGPDGQGTSHGVANIDDLYIVDSATTLGERKIETIYPTSDVAQGFARSTGATNYTLVDEAQVNGDTDYVQGSAVSDVDTYGFTDLATSPSTIDAVQVTAFAEKTDAAARSIALQVKSGATTSDGSNFALAASYGKFERLMTTDPNGSIAWTASAVNALQGGPKVTV